MPKAWRSQTLVGGVVGAIAVFALNASRLQVLTQHFYQPKDWTAIVG